MANTCRTSADTSLRQRARKKLWRGGEIKLPWSLPRQTPTPSYVILEAVPEVLPRIETWACSLCLGVVLQAQPRDLCKGNARGFLSEAEPRKQVLICLDFCKQFFLMNESKLRWRPFHNFVFPAHQSQTKYFRKTFRQMYLWAHQLQKNEWQKE